MAKDKISYIETKIDGKKEIIKKGNFGFIYDNTKCDVKCSVKLFEKFLSVECF